MTQLGPSDAEIEAAADAIGSIRDLFDRRAQAIAALEAAAKVRGDGLRVRLKDALASSGGDEREFMRLFDALLPQAPGEEASRKGEKDGF